MTAQIKPIVMFPVTRIINAFPPSATRQCNRCTGGAIESAMKIVNECAKERANGGWRDCQPAGIRQPIHTMMISGPYKTVSAAGAGFAAG